jgi:hypothetical protein
MAALFPPWSNTAFRVGLVALVGLGALLIATPMIFVRTPLVTGQFDPVEQPVQFDHRHHVRDDNIDCLFCHDTAIRADTAGIPSTELCMGCHSQVWPDSAILEPVRRSYFTGAPIPWARVHDLPDHVHFNHAVHTHGGIGCVSCHGRVDQMAAVYQVEPLSMEWCISCHRDPESHLRPREHITDMEWRPEGDPQAVGRFLAEQYGTRHLTHCSTCHR